MFLASCIIEQRGFFAHDLSVNECTFTLDPLTNSPIRWNDNRFPVSFYVHESVPPDAYFNFVSATEYWNLIWLDYLAEKGLDGPPLFDIVGENQSFSTKPKADGYNVLFFTDDFRSYYSEIEEESAKTTQTTETEITEEDRIQAAAKIQAVTVVRRSNAEIKDTDIIVNSRNFRFFYDKNYDEDILLASQERLAYRNVSSSRDLTLVESIKLKFLSFFKGFLNLFRKDVSKRNIATRKVRVPKGFIDFPSLMIHELGHSPGLFHSDNRKVKRALKNSGRASTLSQLNKGRIKSVMEKALPAGFARRHIGDFDLDNLFCGYYESFR